MVIIHHFHFTEFKSWLERYIWPKELVREIDTVQVLKISQNSDRIEIWYQWTNNYTGKPSDYINIFLKKEENVQFGAYTDSYIYSVYSIEFTPKTAEAGKNWRVIRNVPSFMKVEGIKHYENRMKYEEEFGKPKRESNFELSEECACMESPCQCSDPGY